MQTEGVSTSRSPIDTARQGLGGVAENDANVSNFDLLFHFWPKANVSQRHFRILNLVHPTLCLPEKTMQHNQS
jgi:hypothetical protein